MRGRRRRVYSRRRTRRLRSPIRYTARRVSALWGRMTVLMRAIVIAVPVVVIGGVIAVLAAAGGAAEPAHVTSPSSPGAAVFATTKNETTRSETTTSAPEPTPDPTLKEGMENGEVEKLQERLMDLDYLDIDEPTSYFGSATKYAVQLFQRQHALDMDGICGPKTLAMIYEDDAKHYTLLEGTEGTDVDSFQRRLKELGYLSKTTGYYGSETIEAVKEFQKRNKLTVDGKAGSQTFNLIYSPDAKESATLVKQKQRKGTIDKFIAAAEKQLGKKYILGAEGPNTFDCSGLVTYCLRQAGSTTGRYNAAGFSQNSRWEKVSYDNLRRGDLIFFYNNARSKVGHVGIIIGGGMMIDASSANGKVVKRTYQSSYWRSHFVRGRRPW